MGSESSGMHKLTFIFMSLLYIALKPFSYFYLMVWLFFKTIPLMVAHLCEWIVYFISAIMVYPYTQFAVGSIIISYFLAIFTTPQVHHNFSGRLPKKSSESMHNTDEWMVLLTSCFKVHADWVYLLCHLSLEILNYFIKLGNQLEYIVMVILTPYTYFKKRLKRQPDYFVFHARCICICILCIPITSTI